MTRQCVFGLFCQISLALRSRSSWEVGVFLCVCLCAFSYGWYTHNKNLPKQHTVSETLANLIKKPFFWCWAIFWSSLFCLLIKFDRHPLSPRGLGKTHKKRHIADRALKPLDPNKIQGEVWGVRSIGNRWSNGIVPHGLGHGIPGTG